VFKFLRFEEPFEKLCFRNGLVWTVGLTVEIKLRFQISLKRCRRGLSENSSRICMSKFGSKQFIHYSNKTLENILNNLPLNNPVAKKLPESNAFDAFLLQSCRQITTTEYYRFVFVVSSSGTRLQSSTVVIIIANKPLVDV